MPEPQRLTPERLPVPPPERAAETIEVRSPERRPAAPLEAPSADVSPLPVAPPSGPTALPSRPLTPLQQEIENVLAEGLAELYRSLEPRAQAEFRAQGEATARELSSLIQRVKFTLSEVLKLIRQWLASVPGISRYFVEQTAKIKADKILKLH